MAKREEMQDLLRFLTKDAKIPLSTAMGKVKELQEASLTSPILLAASSTEALQAILSDSKLVKQTISAAKRVTKKRGSAPAPSSIPSKRLKLSSGYDVPSSPLQMEADLALPASTADSETLASTIFITNRAPLVLAFAVVLLKYTMPEQPMSSRLSLAQAVVSANSRSKARSIGLDRGPSAEEEGWGLGQPQVRIMGRDVPVLRRWGYDASEGVEDQKDSRVKVKADNEDGDPQASNSDANERDGNEEESIEVRGSNAKGDPESGLIISQQINNSFWGLDIEALRSSKPGLSSTSLPIHLPSAARSYLLRAFATSPSTDTRKQVSSKAEKKAASLAAEKEENLGMLLVTLDLLYASWFRVASAEELDRRAWTWYVQVRPEVEGGVAGWGGKGQVRLKDILDLRRPIELAQ